MVGANMVPAASHISNNHFIILRGAGIPFALRVRALHLYSNPNLLVFSRGVTV